MQSKHGVTSMDAIKKSRAEYWKDWYWNRGGREKVQAKRYIAEYNRTRKQSAHGRLYLRDIDRKSITPKSPINNKEVKYIHRNNKLLIQTIKL